MCGIMAVKGVGAVKGVYEGLKNLEYRGYDSAGIAVKDCKGIKVFKSIGYISELDKTGVLDCSGGIAIGHTRWATHGGVTIENCHPHCSEDKNFWVVHNGIIENHKLLRSDVLAGVVFYGETDTEVIPKLIEQYYTGDVWQAFRSAIDKLNGSYAIVMMCEYDDKVYFARKSSPLVIGKGNGFVVSSDVNGLIDCSEKCIIEDNTLGYIDNNLYIYDKNANEINVNWIAMDERGVEADKGGNEHFMIKEINEIPRALQSTYNSFLKSKIALPDDISNVLLVGCGTSYHSCLMGKSYMERVAGVKSECVIASEFIYSNYIVGDGTVGIFVSQSGETADTLSAIHKAKELGIYCIAITNVRESSITRICDSVLYIDVGVEVCVASTKAYTSQILMLMLLSDVITRNLKCEGTCKEGVLGCNCGNCLEIRANEYNDLFNLDIKSYLSKVRGVSEEIVKKDKLHLIGKDVDYITALEGALKIKEVSYIFTDAYPSGELKHGTLSLIEEGSIVIAIVTQGGILLDKSKNAIHEICARGGKCIIISQFPEEEFNEVIWCNDGKRCVKRGEYIPLPNLNSLLMPIVSIIPIDLIAYTVSVMKGYNPDKPRNLAKSVTVE